MFLLAQRRSSRPPSPYSFSESELLDLSDDWTVIRARSTRSRTIRLMGLLAIMTTLTGTTVLLRRQPKALHELLSFVTMGHADSAERLGHRFGDWFDHAKTP